MEPEPRRTLAGVDTVAHKLRRPLLELVGGMNVPLLHYLHKITDV